MYLGGGDIAIIVAIAMLAGATIADISSVYMKNKHKKALPKKDK